MNNKHLLSVLLFIICLIVSGPAWYLVKYQVEALQVPPVSAVGMRMLLAGLLLGLCQRKISDRVQRPNKITLIMICAQGLSLYAINFWLTYEASRYMVSALISVAVCSMIIPNLLCGRFFLGTRLTPNSILGALVGLGGIVLCFINEFENVSWSQEDLNYGVILVGAGIVFSVIGTILTGSLSKQGYSPIWIASRGMVIAGIVSLLYSYSAEPTFTILDQPLPFWGSLLYLALIVTTVSNVLHARFVRDFGAGNASFLWLCLPICSLGVSTAFENYTWTWVVTFGSFLIVCGGLMLNNKVWAWVMGRFSYLITNR